MDILILCLALSFPIFLFVVAWSCTNFFRQKHKLRPWQSQTSDLWAEVAKATFEQHPESLPPAQRLELALKAGMRHLQLGFAMLTEHEGDHCQVLAATSQGYLQHPSLDPSQKLPRSLLYCGHLKPGREMICIDFASLSEWRKHPAFTEYGWETYIGARVALPSGAALAIAFIDSRPRDLLFSLHEKEFVRQLSVWLGGVLQNEKISTSGPPLDSSTPSRPSSF